MGIEDFEQLDYYTLLGVPRGVSADELKRAYRQQMARYHPDRYANASPAEQVYASRRAQLINEAYATLSDFSSRAAYTRSLAGASAATARSTPPPRPAPPPNQPRDHLAELYTQAQDHLQAGRTLQAVTTLREIQQINPFYRDSTALLTQAEAALAASKARPVPPPPANEPANRGRRAVIAGGLGALVLAGLGAIGWATRGRAAVAEPLAPTGVPAGGAATSAPTVAAPTVAPPVAAPTAAPPTVAPATAAPPTAVPTVAPTETPIANVILEEGPIVYADERWVGWPATSGNGWSVGASGDSYEITTIRGIGNIWAFRTATAGSDFLIGADVNVTGGRGGLMLRFGDPGYLAFVVDPEQGSFRFEQRLGRNEVVLSEQTNPIIARGPQARNRLVARLSENDVEIRINGVPVGEFSVAAPPPSALYGFVAFATAAQATATFRDLVLREV